MSMKAGYRGNALIAAVFALACGESHYGSSTPDAATAGVGGTTTNDDTGGMGGASGTVGDAASRCAISLSERCGEFEAGSPRIFALKPDEYRNSIHSIFGVDVDVEQLIGSGPFSSYVSELPPEVTHSPSPTYLEAAQLAATRIAQQMPSLLACADESCVADLITTLAPRVWRSQVSNEEQAALADVFQSTAGDTTTKLQALLVSLLSSWRFYVRTELGDSSVDGLRSLTADELAAKLSYEIWADTPDAMLLDLARSGDLTRAVVLEEQARRLLKDPKATAGLPNFYASWLSLDNLLARDPASFPGWTAELGVAMKRETTEFLNSILVSGDAKITSLFNADYSFVPSELASIYGIEQPQDGFPRVQLPSERRGLLTQPSLLTRTSYAERTSPLARGLLVREDLRCEFIPDLIDHIRIDPTELDASQTPREQAYWVKQAPCSVCHQAIDPIGFGFENFDELGRYRTSDTHGAIDASGQILTFKGEVTYEFNSVPELGSYLAQDPDTFACFAQQFLTWSGSTNSTCSAAQAALPNCENGDLRETLAAAAATDAFRFVNSAPGLAPIAQTQGTCDAGGLGDCATLAKYAEIDLEQCEKCQGAACGTPGCDSRFPCAGTIIVRGCCSDDECDGLAPFCGKATAPHHLCVMDDAL